jgi:hypothetical protein
VSTELESAADLIDTIAKSRSPMKAAFCAAVLVASVAIAMPYWGVDPERTEKVLAQQEYANIASHGYSWSAYGGDDFYATRFTAINPAGHHVAGVVCSGLFFKESTIRFDGGSNP